MGRTLKEKIATLPPQRRARVERRASELINEELSLRELRRALGRTQSKLANDLQVGQDTVARYEQRSDMLLSTLNRYIQAAGGRLSLIAEFPGRASVRLKGIGDIHENDDHKPRQRRPGRKARTRETA